MLTSASPCQRSSSTPRGTSGRSTAGSIGIVEHHQRPPFRGEENTGLRQGRRASKEWHSQTYRIQRLEGAKNPRKNLLPPPDSGSTVRASF